MKYAIFCLFAFCAVSGCKGERMDADAKTETKSDERKGGDDKDGSKYSRSQSESNLKLIAKAMSVYHDHKQKYPPATLRDFQRGQPLLSWRVAILPFLGHQALYEEFDLKLPWDDPHNKKLIARMPKEFMTGVETKEGTTHYRVLVGDNTPLGWGDLGDRSSKTTLIANSDGLANVILVFEATESAIWTQPENLKYEPKGPLPKFGVSSDGFLALTADNNVHFVRRNVKDEVVRPYLTNNNGIPRTVLDPDRVPERPSFGSFNYRDLMGRFAEPGLEVVNGTVEWDAKPLAEGEIWFVANNKAPRKFAVKSGKYFGYANLGKNAVEIHSYTDKNDAKTEVIPAKYNGPTTVLAAVVRSENFNSFNWRLLSK